MDKLKTIAGGLICTLLIVGVLFKSMHWPGASIFIILASGALSVYVLFVAKIMKFQVLTTAEQLSIFGSKSKLIGLSTSILIIGLLFKMLHWPGSGVMLLVGLCSIALICLIYMISFLKNKEEIKITPSLFFITISLCVLFLGLSLSEDNKNWIYQDIALNAININKNRTLLEEQNKKLAKTDGELLFFDKAKNLTNQIENLKKKLYEFCDNISKEVADSISLNQINSLEDYSTPTMLMGLKEPWNPIKVIGLEEISAVTLRENIQIFNEYLPNQIDNLSINTDDVIDPNSGYANTWEVANFYNLPLANIILKLNQIQLEANIACNIYLTSKPRQPTTSN